MQELLLFVGFVAFAYALVSACFEKSLVTPPMFFTAIGVLAATLLASRFESLDGRSILESVAELTLVVVLFIDASRIRVREFWRQYGIPVRLLGIGLPLTILLGAAAAKLVVPEFSIWEAGLLAAILAPTDAALGQAVVSSPLIPQRIRQSLNVESGLNDGIVLPLVMLFAVLASVGTGGDGGPDNWLLYWFLQVTLGPFGGAVVGLGGGCLLQKSLRAGWMSPAFQQLSGVALALVAWAGALQIGGNGFIAAFVAGMSMSVFEDGIGEAMRDFGEAEGQLLSLTTFLLFGALMVVPALKAITIEGVIYAVLSLTLIRIVPVALSLQGLGLQRSTIWFVGWFGPRGLATLLFALLVVGEFEIPNGTRIMNFAVATVLLSMFAHGLTAIPGSRLYSRLLRESPESVEHQPSVEHRNKFTATTGKRR